MIHLNLFFVIVTILLTLSCLVVSRMQLMWRHYRHKIKIITMGHLEQFLSSRQVIINEFLNKIMNHETSQIVHAHPRMPHSVSLLKHIVSEYYLDVAIALRPGSTYREDISIKNNVMTNFVSLFPMSSLKVTGAETVTLTPLSLYRVNAKAVTIQNVGKKPCLILKLYLLNERRTVWQKYIEFCKSVI